MVLKKKVFLLCSFLLFSLLFAEEKNSDFWQKTIIEAFKNSPNIQNIKNTYTSSLIYQKQFNYQWYPSFQFDLQQNFSKNRDDYLYALDYIPSSEFTWLSSPNAFISINQKLPGNGNVSLGTGYGFRYIVKQEKFLQEPQIQFQLNQSLGRGAFGLSKNPETLLTTEQTVYAHNTYVKELLNQLKEIILLLQHIDSIHAEENYYTALFNQYKAEFDTAQQKFSKGLQSNLETYYAQHQYTNAQIQLNEVLLEKREILKELNLLISDFDENNIGKYRNELKEILFSLSDIFLNDSISIEENLDSQMFINSLNLQKFNFQINENNFVPVLYLSSSITPDSNIYSIFSDWSNSFKLLNTYPYPILFQTSIGLKINFESSKARKFRKELYALQQKTTEKDFKTNIDRQKKEYSLLQKQLNSATEYFEKLESEIQTEDFFRENRKSLFEQKIITQNEFYQSETLYYLIYKDYISTFWEMIMCQIDLITLSPEHNQLLIAFLGNDYENNF